MLCSDDSRLPCPLPQGGFGERTGVYEMSGPEPTPQVVDVVEAVCEDDPGSPVFDGLEFPGCVAVPMTTARYEACEERLEFWDEAAGIAMVADSPPGVGHQQPIGLLAGIVERIAQERGSRIARFCELCLTRYGAGGKRRVMQPDECLYLYPDHAELPAVGSLAVGENDPPDVVVEVDCTTDVRCGKLRVYESWAFPELWVEVPDNEPPRRRSQLSGLTVYLLNRDGHYEIAPESRAFPGWRAEEIHLAINEPTITPAINANLRRVGAVLGARDGTGPDDDLLLAAHRRESRAEGRIGERVEFVRQTLRARGIALSREFPAAPCRAALARASAAEVAAASLACRTEQDFEQLI